MFAKLHSLSDAIVMFKRSRYICNRTNVYNRSTKRDNRISPIKSEKSMTRMSEVERENI